MPVEGYEELIAMGWAVLPVSKHKTPISRHGSKQATRDSRLASLLFARTDAAGIAVATGSVSGNLVVLDVDSRHDGDASLVALEDDIGRLPDSVRVTTPGGQHIYFRAPSGVTVKNTVDLARKYPGLDVRGEGGYVVAPPSALKNGAYHWDLAPWDGNALADIPRGLLELLVKPRNEVMGDGWDADLGFQLPDVIGEGSRDNTLCRFAGQLRRGGIGVDDIYDILAFMNDTRCDPPLDNRDVKRISKSAGSWVPGPGDMDVEEIEDSDEDVKGLIDRLGVLEEWTSYSGLECHSTGFATLDRHMSGGLWEGQVTTLIAPTGHGKTSLAMQIAARVALRRPVLVWTMEMTPGQLAARAASQISGDSSLDILLVDNVRERNEQHVSDNIFYYRGRETRDAVRAIKRIEAQRETPPLVIVDYIQKAAKGGDDIRRAVAEVSESLRRVAEHLRLPVLQIAAASRSGAAKLRNSRNHPVHELVDTARETGDIEYDSGFVLAMGLDPVDDELDDEPEFRSAIMSVCKSRFGREGQVEYQFHGKSGVWKEVGRPSKSTSIYRQRVLDYMADGEIRAVRHICSAVTGKASRLLGAIHDLTDEGRIISIPGGGWRLIDP